MNSDYRSYLINNYYDDFCKYLKCQSMLYLINEYGRNIFRDDYTYVNCTFNDWLGDYTDSSYNLIHDLQNIYNAARQRKLRLRKRIESLISDHCLFLTLTFNDSYLFTTTESQRRCDIKSYLSSLGCSCIANVDFGKLNEREHYHAIVNIDIIDCHSYINLFMGSNINFERIRNDDISSDKLSKYIDKLTLHSLKESTKRKNLIYINC